MDPHFFHNTTSIIENTKIAVLLLVPQKPCKTGLEIGTNHEINNVLHFIHAIALKEKWV